MKIQTGFNPLRLVLYLVILMTMIGCGNPAGLQNNDIDPSSLNPGLSVLFFDNKFRFVNEMPQGGLAKATGRPGKPVLILDHQFGNGEVYDSGRSQKVGVQMIGYIHFAQSGDYAFQTLSNDGVEVYIDGEIVVSDPRVHSDQLSKEGEITVTDAGWKPLMVRYFQRKGTAALKLYWRTPGGSDFEIVPATAYRHL